MLPAPENSANPLKTGLTQRQWQSKALLFHRMAEIDLSRDKRIKMKRQTDSLHSNTPRWPVPRWPLLILLSPLTRGLGEDSNGEYTTCVLSISQRSLVDHIARSVYNDMYCIQCIAYCAARCGLYDRKRARRQKARVPKKTEGSGQVKSINNKYELLQV